MKPIFLIGFMGSGKTTLGEALCLDGRLTFIDLDRYIESRCGCSVAEIFANHGEDGFRNVERQALMEVADMQDVVVACGGGTPCFFDNMSIMNRTGLTVFLRASVERLKERLSVARAERPLIAGLNDNELAQFIATRLEDRMVHYGKAAMEFNADRLDTAEQIEESVDRFRREIKEPLRRV